MEKNKFLSGFFWKFNEQIMSQLVTFVVQIILARILSPKDYGIVAVISVFIILADVFVSDGFNSALIQKKDASEKDFSTIFYCSLIFAILVYGVLYLLSPYIALFYHNNNLIIIIRVFALRLPISSFNAIQQAYIARKMAFQKIFLATSAASIISGVIGIVLAYFGAGVWSLVFQYLFNGAISAVILFLQIPWRPHLLFSVKSAKELMGYGWKVMAASFIGAFFNQLRSLIIGRFYSSSSLAYYNRGMQFPNLISNNVDTTISSVLFPYMSQTASNTEELKRLVRKSLRTSTFLIMPLMVGLAVTAKPLILIMLTKKWLPAVPFMQCLSIATAFNTITNTNLQALKASGRSDLLLRLELFKKPVYLVLLIIAIKISVFAVAYTMIIYSIYATAVNMFPNVKVLGYKYREQISDIFPAMGASFIMGLGVSLISLLKIGDFWVLVLQIMTGVLIYVAISLIFKIEAFEYLLSYVKGR